MLKVSQSFQNVSLSCLRIKVAQDLVEVPMSVGPETDCIRAPPRRGRYWEIHPRRPKDFPRPERFPEGEARGKSRGSREIWRAEGMDFPIPPEFWWSTDNLSASIFLQGVDQKILPCGQGRIDSVKINPSLLMMTDCGMNALQKDA